MLAGSTLPVSLLAVAQMVRCWVTAPSFEVFTHLLAGMVVTRGPRTVTGMLTGAGLSRTWSHHRVHRLFSRAAWDPGKVGLALAGAVIQSLVPAGAEVRVAVDDTLARRRGRKVWAARWTHDGSARSQDKTGFGSTWVIAAVLVDLPFASRPVALPVLARLWRGKDTARRSALALAMVKDLTRVAGQRIVHVVADAADHHRQVAALPAGITWTTRLNHNATVLGPPPARTGKRGRPRKKGTPLGTLTQIAATATWHAVTVQRYGQTGHVRLADQLVQWYGPWRDLPVRLILLRDTRKHYDLALITTDLTTPVEQIISRYAARWTIEVVFSQMRQILGVGQARNRTARAVERTVGVRPDRLHPGRLLVRPARPPRPRRRRSPQPVSLAHHQDQGLVPGHDRHPPPSDHRRPISAHKPSSGHQRGNPRRDHRLGPGSMNPVSKITRLAKVELSRSLMVPGPAQTRVREVPTRDF